MADAVQAAAAAPGSALPRRGPRAHASSGPASSGATGPPKHPDVAVSPTTPHTFDALPRKATTMEHMQRSQAGERSAARGKVGSSAAVSATSAQGGRAHVSPSTCNCSTNRHTQSSGNSGSNHGSSSSGSKTVELKPVGGDVESAEAAAARRTRFGFASAGARRTIVGLVGRPELNGRACILQRFIEESGRYEVATVEDAIVVSVKPVNLTAAAAPEAAAPAEAAPAAVAAAPAAAPPARALTQESSDGAEAATVDGSTTSATAASATTSTATSAGEVEVEGGTDKRPRGTRGAASKAKQNAAARERKKQKRAGGGGGGGGDDGASGGGSAGAGGGSSSSGAAADLVPATPREEQFARLAAEEKAARQAAESSLHTTRRHQRADEKTAAARATAVERKRWKQAKAAKRGSRVKAQLAQAHAARREKQQKRKGSDSAGQKLNDLSVAELKRRIAAQGLDCSSMLEKPELVRLLVKQRIKEMKEGRRQQHFAQQRKPKRPRGADRQERRHDARQERQKAGKPRKGAKRQRTAAGSGGQRHDGQQ
jgi:hypothetical protein